MGHYAPDGAYPEGIGYWDYGTSFNAMFLSAIEKAFGTDYGLSELPGFLKTGEYILHAVTPNLKNFAYSDNGGTAFLAPTMFWFYDKTKDASILYNQVQLYKKDGQKRIKKKSFGSGHVDLGRFCFIGESTETCSAIMEGTRG